MQQTEVIVANFRVKINNKLRKFLFANLLYTSSHSERSEHLQLYMGSATTSSKLEGEQQSHL